MLRRLTVMLGAVAAILISGSCERQQPSDTRTDIVIVRVYRDRDSDIARQLDRQLSDFTSAHHTTSSGKWIFTATVEPFNYTEELGGKVATIKPQLVVLDRASDAELIRGMDVDLKHAISACGANRSCPAFIPSWASGDELEAAKQVLNAISIKSR